MKNPTAVTVAVIKAFRNVLEHHPDVTSVRYDDDYRWLFLNSDGTAPEFTNVDVGLLEDAADSIDMVPVTFTLQEIHAAEQKILAEEAAARDRKLHEVELVQAAVSELRAKADALTIAYMAMGFSEFCKEYEKEYGSFPDWGHSQVEAVDTVTGYALLADRIADQFDDHPGVWVYEVAEPYGQALAMHLHAGTLTPSVAAELLSNIMENAGYEKDELQNAFNVTRPTGHN